MDYTRSHTTPFLLMIGSITDFESFTFVCEKKAVTTEIEERLSSGIITLLAVYFTYNLQFDPNVQLVLSFLQEKLLNIPVTGKLPISYRTQYEVFLAWRRRFMSQVTLMKSKISGCLRTLSPCGCNYHCIPRLVIVIYFYPDSMDSC